LFYLGFFLGVTFIREPTANFTHDTVTTKHILNISRTSQNTSRTHEGYSTRKEKQN
jgi:hypothetical protein